MAPDGVDVEKPARSWRKSVLRRKLEKRLQDPAPGLLDELRIDAPRAEPRADEDRGLDAEDLSLGEPGHDVESEIPGVQSRYQEQSPAFLETRELFPDGEHRGTARDAEHGFPHAKGIPQIRGSLPVNPDHPGVRVLVEDRLHLSGDESRSDHSS